MTAAALLTKADSKPQQSCVFCEGNHYSSECVKVVRSWDRYQKLKNDKRCFVCLGKSHKASACKRTKNCRHCGGRHHQSICKKPGGERSDSSEAEPSASNERATGSDVTLTTTNRSTIAVALQTATVNVKVAKSASTIQARLLFDSGSQRSYVTKELRQKLKLPALKSEALHLNTFGGSSLKKQKCDTVELLLSKGGEEISINAVEFPTICSSLPVEVEVENYPHLKSLKLADDFDKENTGIDILIGSDYYWEFMTGNVIKGSSGPVAVESKFGWVLSGTLEPKQKEAESVEAAFLILNSEVGTPVVQDNLKNHLDKFWNVESIGIESDCENMTERDQYKDFLQSIQHDGERYSVKLPWKPEAELSFDHYDLSMRSHYLKA